MISFGVTDAHSNALNFGDLAATEGNLGMMAGMWAKELATPAARRPFMSDLATPYASNSGWLLEKNTNATPGWSVRHANSATHLAVDFENDMSGGASHAIFWGWVLISGSRYVRLYFDGVFVAQIAQAIVRNVNALNFVLGNVSNENNGYPGALGHAAVWNNFEVSVEELDLYAAIYYAHRQLPRPDKLTFWYKGTANPGLDEISRTAPSVTGSVSLVADAVDAYYQNEVSQAIRVASHRLLRRSREEPRYVARVPLAFMNVEPMDLINVSHPELPLAASRLANADENQLMAPWRWLVARATSVETLHLERKRLIGFKDHELFGCVFWSTDRLPGGTSSNFNGLARLDPKASLVVDRSSAAYLEQPDNIKIEVSQELEGGFFRQTDVGLEKMNHIGFLAEDETENFILNNCAKDGETGWTSVDNSGTTDLSTLRLFYPSNVTSQSFRFVRANNSNDTYRHRTFAMVTADAYARLYAAITEEDANSVAAIQLQRDTDSWYWNDTSGAWQASAVWIRLANAYDTTRGVPIKHREHTKPIPIDQDENWTVRFGLEGAALPAGGGEVNFGSISCLKGKLVYSEVPTSSSAMLSPPIADTVYHERTSLPQLFPAARGSLTFVLEAVQAADDLTDDDEHCLYYWQAGATAAQDYDAVLYQKLSGETARVSFVRFISGSLDARAYFEIDIEPGETYPFTAVWTDGTNDDLGEGAYLMRVMQGPTVGVDAHASATHSAAATTTQLWKGCAPAATGYRRAMNYAWNPKWWTRALPVEEAAA